MDNDVYPILLEQLICKLTEKGIIENKFNTEEEFIYYYLNNINKLNKEQIKIFINFILENIEIIKKDINDLHIEKLKNIFNNFNDININNYSLSNINNFIKNLDNTSVLRYVMENNNDFTKLLNNTCCYEFFKKLILNNKYINNSSVLKEIVDTFDKIEQEIKNKTFCKFVVNIDNINAIRFFKEFNLTKQNEFLLYLFENSENENLNKVINFFNTLDSNYIKNNFLLNLLSNKIDILNKIIKKDNNILKKIMFDINELNKTQINNLNQILLNNKKIFNNLSKEDLVKIIPNISHFNNELEIIIINKLQEHQNKDKILKDLIFNINIFNSQQQENISLILSSYKEIFNNLSIDDFIKIIPNISYFNKTAQEIIINNFNTSKNKIEIIEDLIYFINQFNPEQINNINNILSINNNMIENIDTNNLIWLIPNLYYLNENTQTILAEKFDKSNNKIDIIKQLVLDIKKYDEKQKKFIFGMFYLNFELIINDYKPHELKKIINNISYFDKKLQNLIIDQNIDNLNNPNKPIKHFINNLSLIKDKEKINLIKENQKNIISNILKNEIETVTAHPMHIFNIIKLKTYITNKNLLNFEIEINGDCVKKLTYNKNDIISLNDFDEYALLFDKNIINSLKNNYSNFTFNDLNLINYLQQKNKKLTEYIHNNINNIKTNQLISYTYRNNKVANNEKRNFLTNLDNIESVFFKENENYRLLLKIDNKFYTIIDDRVYIVNKSNNDYILGNSFKCNVNVINYIKNQFYLNNYNYLTNYLNKENFRLNQENLLSFRSNFIKNKDKKFLQDSINYIITTHSNDNINTAIKNLQNLFEIINNFKKFETHIIDEKYETKTSDNTDFKLDQDIYFSTDHHGDMSAFLYSLLKSGVAKFKKNEQSYIFFDMETGKTYENYKNYIINNKHNKGNLIPIPNLEINLETQNKFICGGDIIDRGCDSDSVFCLMYHLLHQKDGKNKIKYITGNHENMIITNDVSHDTPLIRKKGNIITLQNLMRNLLKENLMKFSYANSNTIFSHTVFKKNCTLYTLNKFIEDNQKEINTNKVIKLKEKIEQDKELTYKDNKFLTKILNQIYKKCYLNKNMIQNIHNTQIFCDGDRNGLLCFRANSCKKDYEESLINTHQIFGHASINEEEIYFINNNKSMGCDTTQSKGFEGANTHEIRTSIIHIDTNGDYECTRINVDKTINKIKQDIEIENLQDLSDSLSDSLSEISLGLELSQGTIIEQY